MPDPQVPSSLNVSLASLVNLSLEWWRLSAAVGPSAPPAARHALRKIEDFLRQNELDLQSMDGRPFDPGLPLRVIDAVDDDKLPPGKSVVAETLSPLVSWRGQVVRPADVVTRRGPEPRAQ